MRTHEQYVWNIVFTALFLALVLYAILALETVGYRSFYTITPFEFVILALASFRLTRLIVSDKITAFFREQFYDDVAGVLVKPQKGPRRTLADLVSCPWCLGLWSAATVTFFYFFTPFASFPILFLAIAGAAAPFQFLTSYLANKNDLVKRRLAKGE